MRKGRAARWQRVLAGQGVVEGFGEVFFWRSVAAETSNSCKIQLAREALEVVQHI